MRTYATTIIAAAASLGAHAACAGSTTLESQIPIPADTPAWISSLKCGDLLVGDDGVNQAKFLPFSLWLHGYLSGLGSALPIDRLPKFHFFEWVSLPEFDAGLLAYCSKNKNMSAVEAAIDAASFNVNSVSRKPAKLRGVDGKWE